MDDITQIFSALEQGDGETASKLLPQIYRELRELAARRLTREPPGQTLEPTALVHEAYLRLVADDQLMCWDGRRHFFAAAAEAMRRILVENARHKNRLKHGGGRRRVELDDEMLAALPPSEDLLALDGALEQLRLVDEQAAEFVKLRYFSGLTTEQAGELLGLSARSSYRTWSFARAWLYRHIHKDELPAVP